MCTRVSKRWAFDLCQAVFFLLKIQPPESKTHHLRKVSSFPELDKNKQSSGSSCELELQSCSVFLRDEAQALKHSSHHKYLCCASLRLRPRHLMLHLIRTSGGSSWDVLLMNYRFSLLPWRFTMHPVYSHQIFSVLWLELMHRSPPAESSLLISERKLGISFFLKKTSLLIKVGNLLPFNLICLWQIWKMRKLLEILVCFSNIFILTRRQLT